MTQQSADVSGRLRRRRRERANNVAQIDHKIDHNSRGIVE
jgi:hypothetical protein